MKIIYVMLISRAFDVKNSSCNAIMMRFAIFCVFINISMGN